MGWEGFYVDGVSGGGWQGRLQIQALQAQLKEDGAKNKEEVAEVRVECKSLQSVQTELRGTIMALKFELRKATEKCKTMQDQMVSQG